MTGSGKSSIAAHLAAHDWTVIRFGQITMDELARRGLAVTPDNERSVREEIRAAEGMDAYARRLLPRIRAAMAAGPVVLDGLYSWSEYKHLHAQLGARLAVVAVFCPRAVRYARLAVRGERPLTPAEAEARDVAEIEHVEKGGPIAMADYTLLNDGAPEGLIAGLERLLTQLGMEAFLEPRG
jgi:dephospho-CoA kinase